jgi:hypothetical protein
MNRLRYSLIFSSVAALLFAMSAVAQTATPTPAPPPVAEEKANPNPFAPQKAPPLPAGMTGADTSDPRATLKAGMYDAGETSSGLKHITLLKKPDAFALPSDPMAAKVDKGVEIITGSPAGVPPPMKLAIAGLAFANSDLAFQGKYLFQGNFYGVNIYDIGDPANTKLVTSMICPGGQGDPSVYKNLMFMSVEMPNGRVDCGE